MIAGLALEKRVVGEDSTNIAELVGESCPLEVSTRKSLLGCGIRSLYPKSSDSINCEILVPACMRQEMNVPLMLVLALVVYVVEVAEHFDCLNVSAPIVNSAFRAVFDDILHEL